MTGVLRPLALAPGLVLLVACGPTTYVHRTTFSYGASGKVAEARASNAERMAPYEYVIASEYLYQAQWLAGYARFEDANRFSLRSKEAAIKGRQVTDQRERNNELPIFVPGSGTYITRKGAVKRGKPDDAVQDTDTEKPPLTDEEMKKLQGQDAGKKGGAK